MYNIQDTNRRMSSDIRRDPISMKETITVAIFIVIVALVCAFFAMMVGPDDISGAGASECKLPGKNHEDNKPLSWKGKKLIDSGADVCEVAKKCDSMEIKVDISNKKELHETDFYINAPSKIQKELDEYAEDGHGHDNPDMVCYEIEDSVKEK